MLAARSRTTVTGAAVFQRARGLQCMVDPARPDEERVGQAVHIAHDVGRDRFLFSQGDEQPFGTARDRARYVQERAGLRAAGKNERRQRLEARARRDRSRVRVPRVGADTSGMPSQRSCGKVASSLPRLNSTSCVHASQRSSSRRRSRARQHHRLRADDARARCARRPIALESSSIVPYASMRSAVFLTRCPPTSPVVPSSPVRV